jgi:hypothetical protein
MNNNNTNINEYELICFIIGKFLGDGSFYISKDKNGFLIKIEHSIKQLSYVSHQYDFLYKKGFVSKEIKFNDRKDKEGNVLTTSCWFYTKPFNLKSDFQFMSNFFESNKKIIVEDIQDFLT